MTTFCDKLYAEMHEALHLLNYESITPIQRIKRSAAIVDAHLKQLNEFIIDFKFADKEQEIRYFKHFRPMFLKELFYYSSLLDIEVDKSVSDPQTVKDYYKSQIAILNFKLQKSHFLYRYYILEEDHLDEQLFIRNAQGASEMPLYNSEIDGRVSNAYSVKLAELQAAEELVSHLNGNIELIEKRSADNDTGTGMLPVVFWKGSKAQFYELVYALVDSGSVTGTIKQVMEWLGHCLNIRPGNYYSYYQMMRIRKKDRAQFLELLKKFYLLHMDYNDENPVQR